MVDNQESAQQDKENRVPDTDLNKNVQNLAKDVDEPAIDVDDTRGDAADLHYEEPPAMTLKDNLGVAFALVALTVIGFLGYIWLTPGKSISTMLSKPESAAVEATSDVKEVVTATLEHQKCATCGMFADKSASHVVVEWADGSTTHHDSWDCAFGYAGTNNLEMAGVEISHFGSPVESPHFLDATQAWFLYDTEASVEGSMPPFVAAFASKDEAESELAEMGGEIVDYAGLAAKWEITSTPAPVDHSTMEMDGHDMAGMDSQQSMVEEAPATDEMPLESESEKPNEHDHEMNCSYCGMFADKSQSHVSVTWADVNHTHHDCWDCMFFYGSENGLSLESAEVALLNSPVDSPEWVDAEAAWFLYDMDKSVQGSMPPFVGAFSTKESAQAHQAERGGEIVNFAGLSAKWQ